MKSGKRYMAAYLLLDALRENRPMDEIKVLEKIVGETIATYGDEFAWHYGNAIAGVGSIEELAINMTKTIESIENM